MEVESRDRATTVTRIWNKIGPTLERKIINKLIKEKILPKDKGYKIEADFFSIDEWRIETTADHSYTGEEIFPQTDIETVTKVRGRMFLSKNSYRVGESFKFTIIDNPPRISFNMRLITKLAKRHEEDQNLSAFDLGLFSGEMEIENKEKDIKLKKMREEAKPMMDGLGFSEDERNTLIIGALGHKDFLEDMLPEQLVGLMLRVKGESMDL